MTPLGPLAGGLIRLDVIAEAPGPSWHTCTARPPELREGRERCFRGSLVISITRD